MCIQEEFKVNQDQLIRIEKLLCDLIKLIARCHEKIDLNESQIQQLNNQMIIIEASINSFSKKEDESHLTPHQSQEKP